MTKGTRPGHLPQPSRHRGAGARICAHPGCRTRLSVYNAGRLMLAARRRRVPELPRQASSDRPSLSSRSAIPAPPPSRGLGTAPGSRGPFSMSASAHPSLGFCRSRRTSRRGMDELGTILGVWAHPDDEAYLTAGSWPARFGTAPGWSASPRPGVRAARWTRRSGPPRRWARSERGARTQPHDPRREGARVARHAGPRHGHRTAREGVRARPRARRRDPAGHDPHVRSGRDDGSRRAQGRLELGDAGAAGGGKPGSKVLYATVTQEWAAEFLPMWEPFNVFRPGTPVITPRGEPLDRLPAATRDQSR